MWLWQKNSTVWFSIEVNTQVVGDVTPILYFKSGSCFIFVQHVSNSQDDGRTIRTIKDAVVNEEAEDNIASVIDALVYAWFLKPNLL